MTTDTSTLAVGAQAPDLSIAIDEGTLVQLPTLWAQRPLVLGFFGELKNPFTQDNAAQLRDGYDAVTRAGANLAVVVALPPNVANVFEDTWALPYPLLSDGDRAVAQAFGAEGSASFVIDTTGVVRFARVAANLADYPPMTMLLHAICDITGAERPRAEESDPIEYTDSPGAAVLDPALDPQYRAFECGKCGGKSVEHKDISTSGGALSRFFDFQGHRFIASSCTTCGYTELYRRKSGAMRNAIDLLGSG